MPLSYGLVPHLSKKLCKLPYSSDLQNWSVIYHQMKFYLRHLQGIQSAYFKPCRLSYIENLILFYFLLYISLFFFSRVLCYKNAEPPETNEFKNFLHIIDTFPNHLKCTSYFQSWLYQKNLAGFGPPLPTALEEKGADIHTDSSCRS